MTTLVIEHESLAREITFTKGAMTVLLDDGRQVSVPLVWYPRLLHGSPAERQNYEFIGDGEGIHWPDLDEDISVEGILAGIASQESEMSLDAWLGKRNKRRQAPLSHMARGKAR